LVGVPKATTHPWKEAKRMKRFNVELPTTGFDIQVDIDTENPDTDKIIRRIVESYLGWEERLDENNGDYIATFLKQLCLKIFFIVGDRRINDFYVKKAILDDEMWCHLDGEEGIKLLFVGTTHFEQSEYEITEVKR
jgi:hypothetical protein